MVSTGIPNIELQVVMRGHFNKRKKINADSYLLAA